jgi:membrane fusion protein, heavy metal efflux system
MRNSSVTTSYFVVPKKFSQSIVLNLPIPLWLLGVGGIGVAGAAFAAGSFWSSRRTRDSLVTVHSASEEILNIESEIYIDNHKHPSLSGTAVGNWW